MNHTAFLSLGSNIEPRREYLYTAQKNIESQCGEIIKISSVYQSEAWGFQADLFLNQVLVLSTPFLPLELLQKTQAIEKEMGRTQKSNALDGYSSRIIDIDILFFNDWIVNTPELTIPHSQLIFRKFILVPLNELAPDFNHPVENKSLQELLATCQDNLEVQKFV